MKNIIIGAVILTMVACSSPEVAEYSLQDIAVAGEFLFEGPNTLQGKSGGVDDQIAEQLGISKNQLSAVYLKSATIKFEADSLRGSIQSALVQWVSDELELISVATKSPLPASGPVKLVTSAEEDILPYLQDATSSVVVDVNLGQDMEALHAMVTLVLNVEYKN